MDPVVAMGLVGLGSGLLRTFFGPKIKQPKPPPPPPPRLALPPGFKPPVSLKPPTPPPQKQPAPPRPNLLANLAIDMGSMYAMNALTAPTVPLDPIKSTLPAAGGSSAFLASPALKVDPRIAMEMQTMGGTLPPSAYAFPETALTVPSAVPPQWLPSAPVSLPSIGYSPPHSRGSYASWLQPPPDPQMAPATLAPITPPPAPTPAVVPSSATGVAAPLSGFKKDPVSGFFVNAVTGERIDPTEMWRRVNAAGNSPLHPAVR